MCEHISIAGGACTVHEARVGEHVGCVPQQFFAGSLHALFKNVHDGVDVAVELTQGCAFRSDVYVVEAVVLQVHLFHEFKSGLCTCLSLVQCAQLIPGTDCSFSAERIGTACC
ncbi:hypothetical protein D3C80_1567190 [compost metagenome]